jgi:disulfide bond formation protein DsbB
MIFTILAVAVLFLSVFPIGISAYVMGFMLGESPCVLCWEQRVGMGLIALIGLFVLRYGAKPKYLGLAVLVGLYGIYMAIRHSGLHLARDIGQGFAVEILGAHTYTWSFVIFFCCTAAISALIMMARPSDVAMTAPRPLSRLDAAAFIVFLVMIAGNIVQAFASTGPPPFVGQSDPVRFSFNPRHWVWSIDEFRPAPISLRGRWAVEKPHVASADANPATGPFRNFSTLQPSERRPLKLPLRGTPTGLDYDAATDRFLLTTQSGVYLVNGAMDRIERHTIVDPMFAVDLGRFAGAAFLDDGRVVAVGENKSFVALRERQAGAVGGDDPAVKNFRFFLEAPDQFDEVSRGRFATVRAKMFYIMSATFDPATKSIFTITVPNARAQRLVVSRFDASDMTLSEEYVVSGAPMLERLYVTAAAIEGEDLYALSAAHSTLLMVDLSTQAVTDARTIAGLTRPTGMAMKDGELYIVTADSELVRVPLLAQPGTDAEAETPPQRP